MSDTRLPFVKMEGLGNCYVFVEAIRLKNVNPSRLAARISDAHIGIGADGLIAIDSRKPPFRLRIFNSDGSEAEMCGNGLRQAALYLKLLKQSDQSRFEISMRSGVFAAEIISRKGNTAQVKTILGRPDFSRSGVGLKTSRGLGFGQKFKYGKHIYDADCVSIGNPHAVVLVKNFDLEWPAIGESLSRHRMFSNGINVHFVKIENRRRFAMRTVERGSGVTQACGSGAGASLTVGIMRGLLDKSAVAVMPGGNLKLAWDFSSGLITQLGPSRMVCRGEYLA